MFLSEDFLFVASRASRAGVQKDVLGVRIPLEFLSVFSRCAKTKFRKSEKKKKQQPSAHVVQKLLEV